MELHDDLVLPKVCRERAQGVLVDRATGRREAVDTTYYLVRAGALPADLAWSALPPELVGEEVIVTDLLLRANQRYLPDGSVETRAVVDGADPRHGDHGEGSFPWSPAAPTPRLVSAARWAVVGLIAGLVLLLLHRALPARLGGRRRCRGTSG